MSLERRLAPRLGAAGRRVDPPGRPRQRVSVRGRPIAAIHRLDRAGRAVPRNVHEVPLPVDSRGVSRRSAVAVGSFVHARRQMDDTRRPFPGGHRRFSRRRPFRTHICGACGESTARGGTRWSTRSTGRWEGRLRTGRGRFRRTLPRGRQSDRFPPRRGERNRRHAAFPLHTRKRRAGSRARLLGAHSGRHSGRCAGPRETAESAPHGAVGLMPRLRGTRRHGRAGRPQQDSAFGRPYRSAVPAVTLPAKSGSPS